MTIKMGVKQTGENIRDNWQTPKYIMERVNEFYQGEFLDPFPANPLVDAMISPWEDRNLYLNPPYSLLSEIVRLSQWRSKTSLWLTHHNHDTVWFNYLAEQCLAQCLLRKRVKFVNPSTGLPESTAIGKCQTLTLITPYGILLDRFYNVFSDLGRIVINYR